MRLSRIATPVALIIFNRPDTTARVFETIRQAQPAQLFVIADGPRSDHPGDAEKCAGARAIVQGVDWDCRVRRNYAETNMGCKYRVSSGLDWVFDTVEEAIVLEDDCLPSQSFFRYCEALLAKYRSDERIMLISGYNAQGEWPVHNEDYFFSSFGGIWGWASWRRAWRHFDAEMRDLDAVLEKELLRHLLGEELGRVRENQFIDVRVRQVDSWAYPWALARHINSGLATVPTVNLIENIGFGPDATHTTGTPKSRVVKHEIEFPLKHNRFVVADHDYDALFHPAPGRLRGLLRRVKRLIAHA